jgi:hypothetical protein
VNGDVNVDAAAEDVLAQVAHPVCCIYRCLQRARRLSKLAATVDESLFRSDGIRRNRRTFDKLVWVLFDDLAILERARLGLVRVDGDVARKDVLRDKAPLDASGKACATAPAQARSFDHVNHLFRLHRRERLAQRAVTAVFDVHLKLADVGNVQVTQKDMLGHGHSRDKLAARGVSASNGQAI